ncbi:MAG: hypothetical protein ABFS28_11765 [Bacteroidota bacterium]
MKSIKLIQLLFLLCLGILQVTPLLAQNVEYSHPHHHFSFEASPHWVQELHDYNGKVFEVTSPNNNMQILMSFVPDCRNAKKHMKLLSGKKGLIYNQKPYDTVLNQRKAVIMQGTCLKEKEPFKRVVIGIPGSDGLYLMEICCPVECYMNHRSRLNSILGSLRVEV